MTIWQKSDLNELIYGAALLGSGGGGGIKLATDLLALVDDDAQFALYERDDVEGGETCSVVAFLGSPSSGTPNTAGLIQAFKVLGATDLLIPGEIGAVNSLAPFLVGLSQNKGVIDGDAAGRSIPKISMSTLRALNQTPEMAISNGKGIELKMALGLPIDAADDAIRAIIADKATFGEVGAIALWRETIGDAESSILWGTIEQTRYLGEGILGGFDLDQLKTRLEDIGRPATFTYSGALEARPVTVAGGFDLGSVIVRSSTDARLLFTQNENMTYWDSGSKNGISAPMSLCYWDNETARPFTNVEAPAMAGREVTILGIPALAGLTGSPAAMKGFREFLLDFGYAGKLV